MTRLLVILTVFTGSIPLLADGPINTQWQRLCSTTEERQITISTWDNKALQGKCESTDAATLRLNQGSGQAITIDRSSIKRITMYVSKRTHHFLALHKALREHLQWEAKGLPTPLAPFALAAMPVTIAGAAVAAPFALAFDLLDIANEGTVEIVAL